MLLKLLVFSATLIINEVIILIVKVTFLRTCCGFILVNGFVYPYPYVQRKELHIFFCRQTTMIYIFLIYLKTRQQLFLISKWILVPLFPLLITQKKKNATVEIMSVSDSEFDR